MVVGALGFVGFHLVKKLLEDGIKVYGLDISTNQRDEIKEEKTLEIGRNANFIILNSIDENEVDEDLQVIFICYDSEELKDEEYVKVFTQVLEKALYWSESKGIKLIFTSTLEAVNHEVELVTEEVGYNPRNRAGELCSSWEMQIKKTHNKRDLPYVILRFPTLYGPWQPEHFAYHQILEMKAKRNEVKKIEDPYTEDILYIEDAIEAIILAADSSISKETIHITSGTGGQWQKGMDIIVSAYKSEQENTKTKLSNEKATTLLSFHPKVSIDAGVKLHHHHLKKRISTDC